MSRSETKRGNTWTLTLKLEDSADLAGYLADPAGNPWPLVEDEAVLLQAVRRKFRGAAVELANGGRLQVVDLELAPPEDEEFLTERKFRNHAEAERTARVPRTEWPQDARQAMGMVLSAWEYVWRVYKPNGISGGPSARAELQEAAYEIQSAGGISREDAHDLESQAAEKWRIRARLGMLNEKGGLQ